MNLIVSKYDKMTINKYKGLHGLDTSESELAFVQESSSIFFTNFNHFQTKNLKISCFKQILVMPGFTMLRRRDARMSGAG